MANLVDYIVDLFKDPAKAESFVDDPQGALASIGLDNVSPEQIQAVAAMAAPAGAAMGGGDGMSGLLNAVANHHGMPAPAGGGGAAPHPAGAGGAAAPHPAGASGATAPHPDQHVQQTAEYGPTSHASGIAGSTQGDVTHTTFAPQANDLSSHNTEVDSHNTTGDFMSPHTDGVQQSGGGFNLGMDIGDITLGDKNTASGDGAVAMSGDNSGSIVSGDGAVLGDGNTVNNGDIHAGDGSPITFGDGDVDATSMKAGGDLITGNEGPVLNGVDTGGGSLGLDNSHTVYGDENNTEISGEIGSIGGDLDTSHHDDKSVDSSYHDSSSGHNTTVDSHDDNSTSNPTVSTDVSASLFGL
jgi:hypothetical protein